MSDIKEISGIALWQAYCDKKSDVEAQQEELHTLHGACAVMAQENADLMKKVRHWKSNHNNVVTKLRVYTSRPDLLINKQQEEIKILEGLNALLELQLNNAISEIQKRGSR